MSTTAWHPDQSAAYIRRAGAEFDVSASSSALKDAGQCIDIETGVPTPGMTEILGRHVIATTELAAVQREELRQAEAARGVAAETHATTTSWSDPDHVPDAAPPRSNRPVRLRQGAVAAVLAAETMLLVEPVNEILRSGIGFTLEGTAGAVAITSLGALMAHVRGEAVDASEAATDYTSRVAADAWANRATIGLLAVAVVPVAARGYAAWLARGAVDPAAIAFFALLQLVFLVAAFVIPQSIRTARRAVNRLRLAAAVADGTRRLEDADRMVTAVKDMHTDQQRQLDATAVAALQAYLVRLADAHPDSFMGDLVRRHLVELHLVGALHNLVAGGGPTTGPTAPKSGDDDGDNGDEGNRGASGNASEGPRPTPGGSGGYSSPDELLDDVLGGRAS